MITPRGRYASLILILLISGCAVSEPSPSVLSSETMTPTETTTYTPTTSFTQTPELMITSTITPTPTRNPFLTPAPLSILAAPVELSLPAEPTIDEYELAMRPGNEGDIRAMVKMPRYRIAFRFVNSEEPILEGREEILFINQEQAGLRELVLRLYPNYQFLVGGGDHHLQVGDVLVNSEPVDFKYIISNTGILIRLPQTLLQDETVQVEMSFAMLLEPYAQGIWMAPHSYPLLAVRDESGWRADLPTNGDLVYSESGLHVIDLVVPKRMNVAATGTETNRKDLGEDMRIYTFAAPGMRDFTFVLGEELQRVQTTVDGTTIYLWHVSDDPLVNDKLEIVANAVSFFDNVFGPYPYADMDIVTRYDPEWWGPGGSGMEYPGLSTYTHHTENWQWNLVHEVVHQWWFGVVGNDVLMEPWLDEALAEYSAYLYFREAYDEEYASEVFYENVLKDYIEIGKEYGRVSGGEPVGLSVYDFPAFDAMYSWIVYGKGALFLEKLREELGHNVFLRFLQEYYRLHKYQVVTGESFKETAEQVSGVDLDELFDRWVWK